MATGAGVTRKGIRNQTKAVMCPCRNPDVPSHRGPGIVCSSYLPKATADQEIVQVKPIKNIKVAVVIAVTALTITEHLLSARRYSTCFTCIKSFTLTIAWGRDCYWPHCWDEKTKAQRVEEACLSHKASICTQATRTRFQALNYRLLTTRERLNNMLFHWEAKAKSNLSKSIKPKQGKPWPF